MSVVAIACRDWQDSFETIPNVRRGNCRECDTPIAIARSSDLLLDAPGEDNIMAVCNLCAIRHIGPETTIGRSPHATGEFKGKHIP